VAGSIDVGGYDFRSRDGQANAGVDFGLMMSLRCSFEARWVFVSYVRDVAYTSEGFREAQLWRVQLRPFLAPPPYISMRSVSWPEAAAHIPSSMMIADAT
jgi:hypothetical protein